MSTEQIILSYFTLGFGSFLGIFHVLWGIKRMRHDDSRKISLEELFDFTTMKYKSAPGAQLILAGVLCLAMVAFWYFYAFRSF